MNDLLNLFIFAQTPVEELRRWLAETPHRFERYAPGERIIAQGVECRSALLLTAGTANTEMVQDGRDLAIDVLKAPHAFGLGLSLRHRKPTCRYQ